MISAELIAQLLALPDRDAQIAFLQTAGLYDESGLSALLAYGQENAPRDPATIALLAALLSDVAALSDWPAVASPATYLEAQTHAMRGQFADAQPLIDQARAGYLAIGNELEAWRTTVGLMMVLGETGDYVTAIDAATTALGALAALEDDSAEIQAMLLQNRGICHEQIGAYDLALTDFATAANTIAPLNRPQRQAAILNNQGVLFLALGQATEALQAFQSAAALWGTGDDPVRQGGFLSNSGYAYWLLGTFSQSLTLLQQAYDLQQAAGLTVYAHQKLVDSGDVYRTLNLHTEADTQYAQAHTVLSEADTPYYLGRCLYGWGITAAGQGDSDEARSRLNEAVALFTQIGHGPWLAQTLLALAALDQQQGDIIAAQNSAEAALALANDNDAPLAQFSALLLLAELSLTQNRLDAASQQLAAATAVIQMLDMPPLRFRLAHMRGRIELARGNKTAALDAFQDSITEIERLRGLLEQPSLRTAYFDDKIDVYADLIALYLDDGDNEAAFALAERAKSRTLTELMTGMVDARLAASLPPETVAEWEQLRADLNALYTQLLSDHGGDQRGQRAFRLINARAVQIERSLTRLQHRHELRAATAQSVTFALTTDAIRAQLPAHTALIAYHLLHDEVMAFVLQDGHVTVKTGLASAETIHRLTEQLRVQLHRLHAGRQFTERHLAQLELSAQRVLRGLHDALFAPLRHELHHENVVIVPHGMLHRLPFHAFFDGSRYVVDDFVLSYAPSVSAFALCEQRVRRPADRVAIFGVGDAQLSGVSAEIDALARRLPHARVFRNHRADTSRFHAVAPESDWIHVACHGIFRPDNPAYSALKLHDSWLTARDIAGLRLPDALVTLSACESGVSHVNRGDEILGLTRAFLSAGASSLIVSLWLVEDAVAAEMMPYLYNALVTYPDRAVALQQAQLAIRDAYPHPFYWSPFCLIGKR